MRFHRMPVVVCLIALAVGCSPTPGDPVAFHDRFDEAVASLPPLASLSTDNTDAVCSNTLGSLRTARAELPAAPSETIAGSSQQWFDIAESTFFECPPNGDDIGSFADAYATLDAIDAEIDALRSSS